jgi:hypothetical protein
MSVQVGMIMVVVDRQELDMVDHALYFERIRFEDQFEHLFPKYLLDCGELNILEIVPLVWISLDVPSLVELSIEVECAAHVHSDLVLGLDEDLELLIVLDDFVSLPLEVVQERAHLGDCVRPLISLVPVLFHAEGVVQILLSLVQYIGRLLLLFLVRLTERVLLEVRAVL